MFGSTLEVAELLSADSHLVEPLVEEEEETSLLPPELLPKQIGGSLIAARSPRGTPASCQHTVAMVTHNKYAGAIHIVIPNKFTSLFVKKDNFIFKILTVLSLRNGIGRKCIIIALDNLLL